VGRGIITPTPYEELINVKLHGKMKGRNGRNYLYV
jgi:hypothetical protein